jgi:hypothetical protein
LAKRSLCDTAIRRLVVLGVNKERFLCCLVLSLAREPGPLLGAGHKIGKADGGHFFNQRLAEAVSTEKSIAVLPFENISANKDDAYFADGVQDEILNNLAKIAQLKVISRTSVMQYRADNKRDLRQIASALGVANVLEGTVRS